MKHKLVLVGLVGLVISAALVVEAGATSGDGVPEGGTANWRSISVGTNHACGIRTTGRLYCWGYDAFGQLGNDASSASQATPDEVFGGLTTWRQVSAGPLHTCATTTASRLFCWGRDFSGQVGNGAPHTDVFLPAQVSGARTDWATVTTGRDHTCALRTTGRLFCWGRDDRGQLGDGAPKADRDTPSEVSGARTDWTQVSAGDNSTCARRTSGRMFCSGSDGAGQLGNSVATDPDQLVPVQVDGARTDWVQVSVGDRYACARRTSGRLFCWGVDDVGQLGNGVGLAQQNIPSQVGGGRTDWVAVNTGGNVTCGRRTGGHLFCWGADAVGEVGDGLPLAMRPTPSEVAGARTDWAGFEAGWRIACALRTNRRAFCWGSDNSAQLGDGPPDDDQPAPVQVEA